MLRPAVRILHDRELGTELGQPLQVQVSVFHLYPLIGLDKCIAVR